MRGDDELVGSMFSYVPLERRIPQDHPLRPMRAMVDEALRGLSRRLSGLYARTGRPSIAPERLLRALLIQILYSVRSERMLMEQLEYNLLFRWFVGLGMDDPVWDATVFTKNRDRLLAGDVARAFFAKVLEQARRSAAALGRALHGGRHADRGVGEPEELRAQGRPGSRRRRGSGQSDGELPRREAQQRDAPEHDGSGGAADPGQGPGREARLSRPRADGESQRPGGGCAADAGQRHRRARGGVGDDRVGARAAAHHARCGSGLRRARVRRSRCAIGA